MIIKVYAGNDRNQYKDSLIRTNEVSGFVCYRLSDRGEEYLCSVKDCIEGNEQILEVTHLDGSIEKDYFSLLSKFSKDLKKTLSWDHRYQVPNAHFVLNGNNGCVGRWFMKVNKLKNHKLLTYTSEIFQYKNREYEACEIGLQEKGIYYVIFENGKNVAIIDITYHKKGGIAFTIYSLEDRPELIHLAMIYYLDRIYSSLREGCGDPDHPGGFRSIRDLGTLLTPYKEIRELYNPNFIPYVKSLDGVR